MTNTDRERMDAALDGMSRAIAQRAAAEGNVYVARLLLRDFIAAMQVDQAQQRELALERVRLEVQTYLDSLPHRDTDPAGEGEAPAGSASAVSGA